MSKIWNIPVTWSVSAVVSVKADTLAEAIELEKKRPVPKNGEYVADSFLVLGEDDPEIIREEYNDGQPDGDTGLDNQRF